MNRNGELTETENVIFYVSYGVLTEFLRMSVILTYFATATATVTECWKSGMSVHCGLEPDNCHREAFGSKKCRARVVPGHILSPYSPTNFCAAP